MPRSVRTAHVFEKKWRSDDVRLQEEATFSSLLLPEKILSGLESSGYKTPSPIQLESIPVGRFGRDLLVQAKSGTGKTLVFTVIALESLSEIKYPQVLIMAPTREIALQICDVVRAVGSSFKGLTCNCFIGGISVDTDVEKVHGCQIIVGTPGRLKHLISLGILPTNSIRLLVLDEADVLLESNFKDDLDYIFVSLPKDKQVIATSATYPKELKTLTRQYFRKVYLARLNRNELTLLGMVHYIQVLESSKMSLLAYKAKLAALERVVTSIQFTQCLVFCNLISRVESLCYDIRNWGFTSTFISSAKEQCDRIRAIECLKRFKCKILVTSDITSRGIDAENVDLVVNFDKPLNTEVYFHRCGRAGRYGAKGVAITFLEKDEVAGFEQMKLKHNLKAYNLPDPIPSNLINIRPREYNSSTEDSEEEDSSDDISNKESNDLNDQCNGKSSSNLNGHSAKNDNVKDSPSSDKNVDCNLEAGVNDIDTTHEKDDCVNSHLNVLCKLDTTEQGLASKKAESEIDPESNENVDFEINRDVVTSKNSEPKTESQVNHISNEIRNENLGFEINGDAVLSEKKFKSEINRVNIENENVSFGINGDVASIKNNLADELNEKNSFLEYLQSGPKKAEPSSSTLVSDSGVIVNNNKSTESVLSHELKVNATMSETKDPVIQKHIQHNFIPECSNNVTNMSEEVIPSQDVIKEECNESNEKLVSPSDSHKTLTVAKNSVVSTITSLPVIQDPSPSAEGSNETNCKFVPNKIQLSVGKFLIEHANKSNLNNFKTTGSDLVSSNKDLCDNKTETEQDIIALKDIREDLTGFYSKVYKAYQAENISNTDFESIKALLIQQSEEDMKQSSKKDVPIQGKMSVCLLKKSDGKKVTSEIIPEELKKENAENFSDVKVCGDNSSQSVVSNEAISSQTSNTVEVGQAFERYVFEGSSSDNSESSSDSSCNEDSYLTLKDTFDNMKRNKKANTKTSLHASQKREKEKCVSMKKKKYTPIGYLPNPVNVYNASHSQLGNVCCHNCSNTWYQIYQNQWQYIHSSLF